jgi:hypothetical protein
MEQGVLDQGRDLLTAQPARAVTRVEVGLDALVTLLVIDGLCRRRSKTAAGSESLKRNVMNWSRPG